MNDDMRELNEKELLDVSGGLNGGYADVALGSNNAPDACGNYKKKKDCENASGCAWNEQQTCGSKK